MRTRPQMVLGGLLAAMLLMAGCGDDDGDSTTTDLAAPESTDESTADAPETTNAAPVTTTSVAPETTTTVPAEPIRILVTNDDGFAAAGLDILVERLLELPGVEVTVVAPNENKSGSGSQTTPGELAFEEVTTLSGYPAVSVTGFPADSVLWALANLPERPHIVVSGINPGQNIGPFAALSGTVGAGRVAAENGIPAVAFSQGILPPDQYDFEAGAQTVVDFLDQYLDDMLEAAEAATVPNRLWSVNIPSCPSGEIRGLETLPPALTFGERDVVAVDCESTRTLAEFVDDVDAFINGFASAAEIDVPETFDAIAAANPG